MKFCFVSSLKKFSHKKEFLLLRSNGQKFVTFSKADFYSPFQVFQRHFWDLLFSWATSFWEKKLEINSWDQSCQRKFLNFFLPKKLRKNFSWKFFFPFFLSKYSGWISPKNNWVFFWIYFSAFFKNLSSELAKNPINPNSISTFQSPFGEKKGKSIKFFPKMAFKDRWMMKVFANPNNIKTWDKIFVKKCSKVNV